MNGSFRPILKLLTLTVGFLLGVTLLISFLLGVIVMVFNGITLPPLTQPDTSGKPILTEAKVEIYKGVMPKEGLWQAPDWNS